jgi:hypothetical protein
MNNPLDMLGLSDIVEYMLVDEEGSFDKRKEPARALVLLEAVLDNREMIARILERALVQQMKDGQELFVDGEGLFEGPGMIKLLRHEDHLHIENVEPKPTTSADGTYTERVAQLQSQIYSTQYYVELYQDALRKNVMSNQGVEQHAYESDALSEMLNDFWFSLPDSPAIRTGPFFLLCDLCEGDPENDV